MPLVEGRHDALPTAASVGELAPVFARAAVVLVGGHIDALVLAASAPEDVAYLVVLLAVISCPGVSLVCCEEPADSLGRHQDRVTLWSRLVTGVVVHGWLRLRLHLGDGPHGDGDGQSHGYDQQEDRDLQGKCHSLTLELGSNETYMVRLIFLEQLRVLGERFEWRGRGNLYLEEEEEASKRKEELTREKWEKGAMCKFSGCANGRVFFKSRVFGS